MTEHQRIKQHYIAMDNRATLRMWIWHKKRASPEIKERMARLEAQCAPEELPSSLTLSETYPLRVTYQVWPLLMGGDSGDRANYGAADPGRILNEICTRHGITKAELRSDRRDKTFVRIRWEAMHALARHTTLSLPGIGKLLGRDHTTVLYGLKRHRERMEKKERAA